MNKKKLIQPGIPLRAAVLAALAGGAPAAMAGINAQGLFTMDAPYSTPDYFAIPNFAYSPLPEYCDGLTVTLNCTAALNTSHAGLPYIGGGIRKFVNGLPLPSYDCTNPANQNNIGQCIPIAKPDRTTFPQKTLANGRVAPAADYYVLEAVDYNQQLHSDLPPTGLRGYRQLPAPGQATVDSTPRHLGPVIFATRNRPTRVKLVNSLSKNLAVPNDPGIPGAGSINYNGTTANASQKRVMIHLHGGDNPWISDGTPHQWTTPKQGNGGANVPPDGFSKGFDFQNVPDMVNGNASVGCAAANVANCFTPGLTDGIGTYYFPNGHSNRMEWYHDHSFGITRLNVMEGLASAYFLVDNAVEQQLKNLSVPGTVQIDPATGLVAPTSDLAHSLTLVLQDKTFVPDNGEAGGQLAAQDPTWPAPSNAGAGGFGKGQIWMSHVYMPNQLPFGITDPATGQMLSIGPLGRYDYGPWLNPPFVANNGDVACTTTAFTSYGYGPGSFRCPGTGNPQAAPENFEDTPLVNGAVYPTVNVKASPYRFRILNAANDRFFHMNLFYAVTQDAIVSVVDPTGVGSGAQAIANITPTGTVASIDIIDPGTGYDSANPPTVTIMGAGGTGATATAVVDPITSMIDSFVVNSPGSGYVPGGTLCKNIAPADVAKMQPLCTELKLIAPAPHRSAGNPLAAGPQTCTGALAMDIGQSGQVTAPLDGNGNLLYPGTGMPAATKCWPNAWPTDGTAHYGGVPDPNTAGPAQIVIGNEGGVLPNPVALPATPDGFNWDRRMATLTLVKNHTMWIAPAERYDAVVDFSATTTPGNTSVLIYYNDSPAPAPLFDPRFDMFTGDMDQTGAGGAPTTLPGYGPNTRSVMQFVVNGTDALSNTFVLGNLTKPTGIPQLWSSTQDQIIVPEPGYPAGNGFSPTVNAGTYNTFSFPNLQSGTIGSVNVTNIGSYTAPPLVNFTGGTPAQNAVARATLANGPLTSVTVNSGGSYSSPPTVVFNPTGATGTAVMTPASLQSVSITNGGSGYTTAPTVTIGGFSAGTATVARGVSTLTLTNAGAGYTAAPTVSFTGGGGTGAAATATLGTTGGISGVTVTGATCTGTGTQTVTFGGTGRNARATATITRGGRRGGSTVAVSVTAAGTGYGATGTTATIPTCTGGTTTVSVALTVASLTVTNGGSGYTTAPTVRLSAPAGGGTTATATATVAGVVTGVNIAGTPAAAATFTTTPTVTFTGGGGRNAAATANLGGMSVASVRLTNAGSYATPPRVSFTGGCPTGAACVSAQATANMAARGISSIAVTNPGSGYKLVPTVTLTPTVATDVGGGVALANMSPVPVEFKGLMEGFDPVWGTLYIELTASNPLVPDPLAIAPMPFVYLDPVSEAWNDGVPTVWRMDHIGVDTHGVHIHLADQQVINSADLAGQLYQPDATDMGWKDTIKYSPFQSTFIALKPKKPNVPWELPNSIRPIDPTLPLGTVDGPAGCVNNPFAMPPMVGPNCVPFALNDPQGNAVNITNSIVNFGAAYVWHCHLLAHEEHDMMRPIQLYNPPETAPTWNNTTVTGIGSSTARAVLSWKDTTVNETGFVVEQCTGNNCTPTSGTWTQIAAPVSTTGPATGTNYTFQTAALPRGTYYWRVRATNLIGCADLNCSNPFNGWPSMTTQGPNAGLLNLVN